MMKMPTDAIVVLDIAGSRAKLYSSDEACDARLKDIGFDRSGDFLERAIADDGERRAVVKSLVEAKALFSSGRDWSPEEIVSMYQEQGFIDCSYRVISWKDPYTYEVFWR